VTAKRTRRASRVAPHQELDFSPRRVTNFAAPQARATWRAELDAEGSGVSHREA
jgi:hypothetical protein